MKKIPSLFLRDWEGNRSLVTREVNPECAWVVAGEGVPTRKRDGTACLVRDGVLFRRYDVKPGRTPPPGFEPCQDPDPETGHAPGWVPIGDGPADRWYRLAFENAGDLPNGTYELWRRSRRETLVSDAAAGEVTVVTTLPAKAGSRRAVVVRKVNHGSRV